MRNTGWLIRYSHYLLFCSVVWNNLQHVLAFFWIGHPHSCDAGFQFLSDVISRLLCDVVCWLLCDVICRLLCDVNIRFFCDVVISRLLCDFVCCLSKILKNVKNLFWQFSGRRLEINGSGNVLKKVKKFLFRVKNSNLDILDVKPRTT